VEQEGPRLAAPSVDEWSNRVDRQDYKNYELGLRRFFARRVVGRSEIDDFVQEALVRFMHRSRQTLVEQPFGYLLRIANNLLIDEARACAAGRVPVSISDDTDFPCAAQQEDRRNHDDLQQRLNEALDELPQKCRDAFIMKRFHEMDTPAIARRLNISHRMVQKHLIKAMSHLHERINKDEDKTR
jgi:RNA polymerase sigma factor (sigma-70 family)